MAHVFGMLETAAATFNPGVLLKQVVTEIVNVVVLHSEEETFGGSFSGVAGDLHLPTRRTWFLAGFV